MPGSPPTQTSLLLRVRDAQDEQAWKEFAELYVPLVYGFVRKHGLQEADAADVTQEVMCRVARAIRTLDYDPARGSFRGWLFTLVRNQLHQFHRGGQRPDRACGGTSIRQVLHGQPAPEEDTAASWDQEYERRLFAYAAAQIRGDFRDSTWQAFWLAGVEGKSAREVGEQLGLTVAAVYLAKSRVMARLKEQIQELERG
jgi:RNA polymerase sigma-70 factor (ECF subfamily)